MGKRITPRKYQGRIELKRLSIAEKEGGGEDDEEEDRT